MRPSRPAVILLALAGILAVVAPSLAQDATTATASATVGRQELPLPGGAPEILNYKSKTIFLLDRSGSMLVAGRFEKALDIIDQLLEEMPTSAEFDIYLVDDQVQSLFKNEWYHALPDIRKSIRKRIDEAGGVACSGFTDLVGAVKLAVDKRRPNGIYLLTDGVETVGDLETAKVSSAIAKASSSYRTPVNTIGIALGAHAAEDLREATSVLKGIADATGGVFRSVKTDIGPDERPRGRALVIRPAWMPPASEDLVRFHVYPAGENGGDERPVKLTFGHERLLEIFARALSSSPLVILGNAKRAGQMGLDFGRGGVADPDEKLAGANDITVEVEDAAMKSGHVVFEYSDLSLGVRVLLPSGAIFSETHSGAIPLKRGRGRATLSGVPKLRFIGVENPWPAPEIQATGRDIDPDYADANGVLRIRVPQGGFAQFVYARGGHEFRETAQINPPPMPPDSSGQQGKKR